MSVTSTSTNNAGAPATPAFSTPEKRERYASSRFLGATGLNWFDSDPTLQRTLAFYMTDEEMAWARPHLELWGELMGGPVSERAEETDKNPPRLVRYDRWGHDVSDVIIPESAQATKRDIFALRRGAADSMREASRAGMRTQLVGFVENYMLCQAEVGMSCALGTGTAMITRLVADYAPDDIREHVLGKFRSGEWDGETAQMFTERTGGSDLGAIETTATADGDAWKLDGLKWFASNANGQVYVVLAKPAGAPDSVKGACSFLVLRTRRDGSPNGVHIRALKEKLGTRAVASCEVEFRDAEAFLLADPSIMSRGGNGGAVGGDGQGLARLMQMTNDARIGVSMMGLGCARRALVEALCYVRARSAFGRTLVDQPLMRRKLAEMIVDVEAVLALVFDANGSANRMRSAPAGRLRLTPAVVKLKAARLGITMASDAIEIHGGNGYIETWPVARILRDAQVNTIWEGADNILCLDVRRAIERERADEPFLDHIEEALNNAGESVTAATVAGRLADLREAVDAWKALDRETAEARLFPLGQFMGDVYAGAMLVEQAAWERAQYGDTRKELVAELFARRYLTPPDPLRGITATASPDLDRFEELVSGALVDPRGT